MVLCVNGEIFNHKQLRSELCDYAYTTHSDCEVILPGYLRDKEKFVSKYVVMCVCVYDDVVCVYVMCICECVGDDVIMMCCDMGVIMWIECERRGDAFNYITFLIPFVGSAGSFLSFSLTVRMIHS